MEDKVIYKNDGYISWIILNRANKLNALDYDSWNQLYNLLIRADNDGTKIIVLTGSGRAFSTGDDINAMYGIDGVQQSEKFFNSISNAVEAMIDLKKPLISLVNGLAYGGGCEILLLSDIVIASSDAKFSIPEGKLGLIPPMAVTIGYKTLGRKIMRLLLTGEEINANEAKEIGIVDYISPKEKLNDKLNEVISSIDKIAPESIKSIKSWTRKDKRLLEKAITELSFMVTTPSAKEREKMFMNKK